MPFHLRSASPLEAASGPSRLRLRPAAGRRGVALVLLAVGAGLLACSRTGRPEGPAPTANAPAAPEGEARVASLLPPPRPGGGFTDVTLAAGIGAEHRLPGDDVDNIVDSLGGGAAFADLDGDGWLDLVVAGGPRSPTREADAAHGGLRLYRNLGDGRFEDITERAGLPARGTAVALAIADYDGDGDRDLYLVDRGPNRLYRNRGDAVFRDVTAAAGVGDARFGVGAVFFDADGDGDLDLYVTNYLEFDPRQKAYYAPDAYPGPLSYRAEADVLYRNRGDGTFEDVSGSSGIGALRGRGMSLAVSDFDDDGDLDVFVANDATANFLWLNDGRGNFSEAGLLAGVAMGENGEQTAAMAADVGDVDGDGQLDLLVSDTAYGAFYRRVRPGMFTDRVMDSGLARLCGQYVSWGQNLIDFDDDGDLDLFVVNADLHHVVGWEDLLLRNDGTGRFERVGDEGGPYFEERRPGRGSVVGDYDNDGDLDLFITNLQGRPVLLRNDRPEGAAWLVLELTDAAGREAFGARVELEADGRRRVAEQRPGTTYLGQSDPRLHFGLGTTERVERLRIRWPGGSLQEIRDLPARRFHRIVQEAAG